MGSWRMGEKIDLELTQVYPAPADSALQGKL